MEWNELFFRQVYNIAAKSKDPSSKIGAVLVADRIPIMQGYNGFPRGVHDLPERLNDRRKKLQFTAHAEANVINQCARRGVRSEGATLYTNALPCEGCMKDIINGGVAEIVIHKQYQEPFSARNKDWSESHEIAMIMAKEAGLVIETYDKVLNIQTLMGGILITV